MRGRSERTASSRSRAARVPSSPPDEDEMQGLPTMSICSRTRASSTQTAPDSSRSSADRARGLRRAAARRRGRGQTLASTRFTWSRPVPLLHCVRGGGRSARPRLLNARSSRWRLAARRRDASALKVHLTRSIPSRADGGIAMGAVEGVEIANMHHQTATREERLAKAAARCRPSRPGSSRSARAREPASVREPGRDASHRGRPDDEPIDRGSRRCDRSTPRPR